MKQFTLYLILLSALSMINAQTTFVPDDNFEQALIDLGYDDILDDEVLTQNIVGITQLSIQNKSITDLTGLEDFASLTNLLCDGNGFSSITFHPNVNLTSFICQYNQLTEIDLGQHTNLISFACTSNNLTSLDVSANQNLIFLVAGGNQFTELDLSNNPNIDEFGLTETNPFIESLDIRSGNNTNIDFFDIFNSPNLEFILVDDCAYSTQNWTNIDSASTFIEIEGQTECSSLSVNEVNIRSNFSIYPNPVKDFLTIENINNVDLKKIEIFSVLGKKIKTITNQFKKIDFQLFSPGLYFINIYSEDIKFNLQVIKK
ncbi:T9SS type A sorting domain-containing protein [Winogradskyella forsetii]|uniref:T9SS type A sorting domain-containing protein n=1 Tax=Winogradskyella forsetii TaxID=2686077 RepID=UPI0015BD9228|nr:T9SS type A sorting domain-containing protein [Winogradskyella forsetii]